MHLVCANTLLHTGGPRTFWRHSGQRASRAALQTRRGCCRGSRIDSPLDVVSEFRDRRLCADLGQGREDDEPTEVAARRLSDADVDAKQHWLECVAADCRRIDMETHQDLPAWTALRCAATLLWRFPSDAAAKGLLVLVRHDERIRLVAARVWSCRAISATILWVPRSADFVSLRQYEILKWISEGCPEGVYEGTGHRQTARALHNRRLVRISGHGATWQAVVTEQGVAVLAKEKVRIQAELERQREEEERRAAEREQERQAQATAETVLGEVVAEEGRLEVGTRYTADQIADFERRAARSPDMPHGKRLTHEPIKMDESLGFVLYLEPSFEDLIALKPVHVPGQLRKPHELTTVFRAKRANVSKACLPRAARILEAIITTALAQGWKVRKYRRTYYQGGPDDEACDLTIAADDTAVDLLIGESDAKYRKARPYTDEQDYLTRATKTVANRYFEPSGRLYVRGWFGDHNQPGLHFTDDGHALLERRLPELFKAIEVRQAQQGWVRQEQERKRAIKQQRWDEIFAEAKLNLADDRRAVQLQAELELRRSAIEMREYAEELERAAAPLAGDAKTAAKEWISWIRARADRLDPRSDTIAMKPVGRITHSNLDPYMRGWSTWRP